ncbi:TonB-dependent receptor plug domain-containing protein [Sunxiuqinia sp. A32]|uniref:TonB-dependent receptor plug domain-containing protein n=1 Tax=Sunxiuqinia sp. A32 TaxID=3461496 RepID=UPI004045471D
MGKITLFLIIIFYCLQLGAQEVFVYDSKNGNAIDAVLIYSETQSTQTDKNGKASLDIFKEDEPLIFQHSSYLKHQTTLKKIWSQNYRVRLIEDPVSLDEIVISANRREQSKREVPNKIVSISQEEISFSNSQTTADLLASKGGIFIQKSQMGGGSPMIRGFSANRLLLVVDGIRMNNAIYRNGNLHNVISLDASTLEHAEVIFGPSSVMYGSDALGGVFHFQTLSPKLSTKDYAISSQQISGRYSSANFEKTFHTDINYGAKKWAMLTSISYSDFDDLQMGNNGSSSYLRPEYVRPGLPDQIIKNSKPKKQIQSGYYQYNLMEKIRFRPNNNWDLNYAYHYSKSSNIPRYDRLIQYSGDQLKYAEWYYGPQLWQLHSLQVNHSANTAICDKANLIIGWQKYTESRHNRKLNSEKITDRQEDLNVLTLNLDLDKKIDQNNFIFYGVEGNYNRVKSTGEVRNLENGSSSATSSRYPDGSTTTSLAAYLSYKLTLNKRFALHAGGRYTLAWLNGDFDSNYFDFPTEGFSNQHSSLTGNIGLVYHPSEGWQLNATASTGFRSPNIDDIAKVFDSTPGHVIVPNPDLKPEYARNLEVGIVRSYSDLAKIELSLFYTYLDEVMVRREFTLNGMDSVVYDGEMSKVEALVNDDYAHIYGGSFLFELLLSEKILSRNSITLNKGRDSHKLPVRHVAPLFGTSHLIFDDGRKKFDFYINYNGSMPFEKLAPSEQEKLYLYAIHDNGNPYSPAWLNLNFKSSFRIYRKYYINLGMENILNKRYRPYSSGIVAAGRNFIVSFRANI